MRELFPICRSLTGNGVRETLAILKRRIPLTVYEVPSGTRAFDWTVPNEWNIREAYVIGPNGEKVIDFKNHNLHLVGYSEPVDMILSLDELQSHLHSIPDSPDAIPYVFSYYRRTWGFCLAHRQRETLQPGNYRVRIDSSLQPGFLTYADLVIPGLEETEVFFSTYICHPSMANNELSGPVVCTHLAEWLASKPRRHTYRFVFIPESIGSLVYLERHLRELRARVIAGFNVTCVGDEKAYSYLPSRYGDSLADKVLLHALQHIAPDFRRYTYLDRGSDERQYCSPGIDLPLVTFSRSLFRNYPEYHSSLDDLELVTESGLRDSLTLLQRCVEGLEANRRYLANCLGEPQLGPRNLYNHEPADLRNLRTMGPLLDFLAYADGGNDLFDIANRIKRPVWDLALVARQLHEAGLVDYKEPPGLGKMVAP